MRLQKPLSFNRKKTPTHERHPKPDKKCCVITCGTRCPSVRHGESAAVKGLPEGAETAV